jgi:hypothetical protein
MSIIDPTNDAPKSLQAAIARIGGKNPYGEPMWRVVLAQHCIVKRGGILRNMGDGEQSIVTIGTGGKVFESTVHSSVTSGILEVPRYNCADGWILEKWFPASTWGTREQWASEKSENGSRLLCEPYPERGRYFLMNGPFDKIPALGDLENSIAMYEEDMRKQPTNHDAYFRQVMRDEEYARKEAKAKLVADLNDRRKNELVPVLKSTSLEAQRFRNQLTAQAGMTEHLGAVHDA